MMGFLQQFFYAESTLRQGKAQENGVNKTLQWKEMPLAWTSPNGDCNIVGFHLQSAKINAKLQQN
jgi:hypothetical protein